MKLLLIATIVAGFAAAGGPPNPDFSGSWKQDNERCAPKRSGDVTLKIQHQDSKLVVETTSKGLITRHALQNYSTDGAASESIGADGDKFHSAVVWKDHALVFDIVETEDGKQLKSTEIWSLVDGGRSLERVRHTEKSGEQTLIYVRIK